MLTCLPRAICSWNYIVRGTTGGESQLTFNWFTEQGTIQWGGQEYEVVKHGPFSGRWTLEHHAEALIDARKTSPFTRKYELVCEQQTMILQAQSIFARSFELLEDGVSAGTFTPAHPFTRRATIRCHESIDELTQLFAFWLVVITWKRAAKRKH